MNKSMAALLLIITLTSYAFIVNLVNAQNEETSNTQLNIIFYSGMRMFLETPWYVNSNSSFNVTLVIVAEHADLQNITVEIINVMTFVDEEEYYILPPTTIKINNLTHGENYTKSFEITLPENASKIVMGEIDCNWIIPPKTPENQHTMFPVAVIIDYWRQQAQNLQNELNWYKTQYEQLNQSYRELEDEYRGKMGALDTTRRLAVIFGVTTALFVLTTLYLFRRRPQVW